MEQTASTENQKQSQPSHRPEIKKTPVRGKRAPFWMLVTMTIIFSSFMWTFWIYNGKMSVSGLFLLWTFLMHSTPPPTLAALFTAVGWGLVIVTTIGELVGFWVRLTKRPTPEWLRGTGTAFVILIIYDLVTTVLGVYQEWTPGMPVDLDHAFQLIAVLIYAVFVTYVVEAIFSAIWKGL